MAKFNLGNMLDIMSVFHMLADGLKALQGNEPASEAKPTIKALYGIFGKGDEQAVMQILLAMPLASQERFVDFCGWLFTPAPGDAIEWIESLFYRNSFFTFIARKHQLGESVKIGDDVTVSDLEVPNLKIKNTRNVGVFSHPESDGKKLADNILARLQASLDKHGGDKEPAYREVYAYLKTSPVPCSKVGETDWTQWMEDTYGWSKAQAEAFRALAIPFYHAKVNPKLEQMQTSIAGFAQARRERDKKVGGLRAFIRNISRLGV